jgi:hypothetical protein
MHYKHKIHIWQFLLIAGVSVILSPVVLYGWLCFLRPPRTNQQQVLFAGINYQREARSSERPAMIHIVTVDLTAPGVRALVTPKAPQYRETIARTTSEFLREYQLQLAINASYFHHFYEKTPWDYHPHSGDPSYPIGEAISNGYRYSPPERNRPVLCFSASNRAQILETETCPEGTIYGVAGNQMLVAQGKPIIYDSPNDIPYPRVAAGTDQEGKKLWLIAIDGKQPFYSEGVTINELTKIFTDLGVYAALNLDGGGSTTLVMGTTNGSKVLNAPIHTRIPMRERPVGSHLGFYALPHTKLVGEKR